MTTIITARRAPWSKSPSSKLRWDAIDAATGDVLATATEYPLSDAAMALADRGWDITERIVLRHDGSETNVFRPMSVWSAALPSYKRAAASRKYADFRANGSSGTATSGFSDPTYTNDTKPICDEVVA